LEQEQSKLPQDEQPEASIVEQAISNSTKPKTVTRKTTPKSASTKSTKPPSKTGGAKTNATQVSVAKKRVPRPYPASSFEEALPLAEAIHKFASGQKVRRLTLLKQLEKSPTSSSTRMLIISSSRYGITVGGYDAEWIDLTEAGLTASSPDAPIRERREAQFKLAIDNIRPFQKLYLEYKGKKLPTHDVLKDVLIHNKFEIDQLKECVDLFVVNAKFLGLLQTIAGSETLIPIEQVLDELGKKSNSSDFISVKDINSVSRDVANGSATRYSSSKVDWSKTCFLITPIGDEDSETRRHADLFLGALIEPALSEFNMDVVRADKIGSAGMITSQILEYVMRSRLAIVDLSYHNPNAFYEMAIRHACQLPVVQISRKADHLPFDVNQVRTVVIDTSDIYTLVPKLETYRSEIATQVRAALSDTSIANNPISVFFPGFQITAPKEN